MLKRLWNDDRAVVVSVELILIVAILVFGLVAGLVALRNSIIATFGTVGNTLNALVPSFTYSGFAIGGLPGGDIALIQGYQIDRATAYLTADQVPPVMLGTPFIPPSP